MVYKNSYSYHENVTQFSGTSYRPQYCSKRHKTNVNIFTHVISSQHITEILKHKLH